MADRSWEPGAQRGLGREQAPAASQGVESEAEPRLGPRHLIRDVGNPRRCLPPSNKCLPHNSFRQLTLHLKTKKKTDNNIRKGKYYICQYLPVLRFLKSEGMNFCYFNSRGNRKFNHHTFSPKKVCNYTINFG